MSGSRTWAEWIGDRLVLDPLNSTASAWAKTVYAVAASVPVGYAIVVAHTLHEIGQLPENPFMPMPAGAFRISDHAGPVLGMPLGLIGGGRIPGPDDVFGPRPDGHQATASGTTPHTPTDPSTQHPAAHTPPEAPASTGSGGTGSGSGGAWDLGEIYRPSAAPPAWSPLQPPRAAPDPRDPGSTSHEATPIVDTRSLTESTEPASQSGLSVVPDPRDPGSAAQHPAVPGVGTAVDSLHLATTAPSPPAESQNVGAPADYRSATDGQAYLSASGAALDARDPGSLSHVSTTNVEANHVAADGPAALAADTADPSGSAYSGSNSASAELSQQQAEAAQHHAEAAQRR